MWEGTWRCYLIVNEDGGNEGGCVLGAASGEEALGQMWKDRVCDGMLGQVAYVSLTDLHTNSDWLAMAVILC